MSIDWWILVYELIGGLALFLFGMDIMTKALKDSTGNKLKLFLHKMTASRWKALLAGTGITAVIQSSSVTTVLAVGFVSAGLMPFKSTLGLILGADIGTTITAQIIAFKVTKTALLLVIAGYLFTLIANQQKYKGYGKILVGLGLIFLGMNFMSEGMRPLKSYPPFLELMHGLDNRWMGILLGALFTALVQSSSATTGVIIILASQGFISGVGGISIVIGANIGTCITAFLSAIGKPKTAMQVAIAHIGFKIIGALIWVWFIQQLANITTHITPNDVARQIANAHTIFNVSNAFLLIWFTVPVAKLINKWYPEKSITEKGDILLLDNYYIQHPAMAIDIVDKELEKLAKRSSDILQKGLHITLVGSITDLEQLRREDKQIDFHQKQILSYLQQIQQEEIGKKTSKRIKKQMEITNILEAAADLVTTDMVEAAEHRIEHNFHTSQEAQQQFDTIYAMCMESLQNAASSYFFNDNEQAKKVVYRKKEIKKITVQIKEHLIHRLSEQDQNRISIIRFETEVLELIGRLYSLARRIARIQLD